MKGCKDFRKWKSLDWTWLSRQSPTRIGAPYFPRKLARILSANQTTKIAANARAKYRAVHRRALPAVVMASSLASELGLLPVRIVAAATA
jgi:hypothetical protein